MPDSLYNMQKKASQLLDAERAREAAEREKESSQLAREAAEREKEHVSQAAAALYDKSEVARQKAADDAFDAGVNFAREEQARREEDKPPIVWP